jgi:hypothetical protein
MPSGSPQRIVMAMNTYTWVGRAAQARSGHRVRQMCLASRACRSLQDHRARAAAGTHATSPFYLHRPTPNVCQR